MVRYLLIMPNYAGLRPAFAATLARPWHRCKLDVGGVRVRLALHCSARDAARLYVESENAQADVMVALVILLKDAVDAPFEATVFRGRRPLGAFA